MKLGSQGERRRRTGLGVITAVLLLVVAAGVAAGLKGGVRPEPSVARDVTSAVGPAEVRSVALATTSGGGHAVRGNAMQLVSRRRTA